MTEASLSQDSPNVRKLRFDGIKTSKAAHDAGIS